jgi:sucrose phosphorylase
MEQNWKNIQNHLTAIYGAETGAETASKLEQILETYADSLPSPSQTKFRGQLTERDAILITYGDQVQAPGEAPLQTLGKFLEERLAGVVTGVHILPFYPYSSDDGFSVIDYQQVNPNLGSWQDIERIGERFGLMFDAVINHISVQSAWFQGFLQDDPRYRDYFITIQGSPDLSAVTRPRALPLLTTFETRLGPKAVWTTFSDDQVDLNYANPRVLLDVIETILFYVSKGAELIRLDAIAYLWKETGTTCIHLEQTHRIIQLMRAVLDAAAPYVQLITETNVPHRENISYFGDGENEAQLVYNFALPPLVLHTLHTGDARALSKWAAGLALPSSRTSFFNFLASHDGVGLNPVRGILSDQEIEQIIARVQAHGGLVSYKNNPDGTQSPYELNISYFDALSDPQGPEPLELQVDRFAAAHAIQFALVGVPGIYFHSLFGSRSWQKGVRQTGRNRTINRQKLSLAELGKRTSLRSQVFQRLSRLLQARASHPAFHPGGTQQVLDAGSGIFAVLRDAPGEAGSVLCLQNVTAEPQVVSGLDLPQEAVDLVGGERIEVGGDRTCSLKAYQTLWIIRNA